MGQVSGSISLDMTKVARECALAAVAELTRSARDGDVNDTPLEIIVDSVTRAVVNGVEVRLRETELRLSCIERKIDALTQLVTAEARRHDRMTGTGELPVVANVDRAGPTVLVEPDRNSYEYQLPGPERESQ